jgi:aminoglycoside phosphotransferase (APT) family kinase protein
MPVGAVIPGVDVPAVSAWIADSDTGLSVPLDFSPVGRGRSNLTYLLVDANGRQAVLRRPPLGELLASAHDIEREMAFLRLLTTAGQPVPAVLGHCPDAQVTGAPFYVMSHVEGVVPESFAVVEARLDEPARAAVGPSLARALAGLHRVKYDDPAFRSVVTTSGESHASRLVRRWSAQWERSKPYEVPLIDEVGRRLAAGMPPQRRTGVVHGDFGIHNCVVSPSGDLCAVLDWEMATLGDPLSDLAWLLMLWPESEADAVASLEPVTSLPGFVNRSQLVDVYSQAAGWEPDALGFWMAMSYWKFTVAIAGIYRRWLQDPANGGEGARELGAQVQPMAERAALAAAQAGL